MERWGQRERSLLFCYPVTEFPVWLGRLPWSLLCWDTYSDTDSDRPAVIDSDKTWPVSGSVVFFVSLVSLVIYSLHMISLLCPTLSSHCEQRCVCVCVRSMTAICCTTSNITACWQHAPFFFCLIKACNFVSVFQTDRSFYLHGKKTQGVMTKHSDKTQWGKTGNNLLLWGKKITRALKTDKTNHDDKQRPDWTERKLNGKTL